MIEGYLPGLVRVDPVGVAPAEVVAQALRCERLEAVAEACVEVTAALAIAAELLDPVAYPAVRDRLREIAARGDAALVAAGATGKAGT